ncbi:MAG: DUF6427 family protein [Bacteroidales bacterium]
MANKERLYWTNALIFLVGGLLFTSFLVPFINKTDEWIPLLSGFIETDVFYSNKYLLAVGGILSITVLAISIYFVNSKALDNTFRVYYTQLFFLLIVLANPTSIYFSTIYPAAILLTWMQFYFIIKQRFIAFFLISIASLFYAPIIWIIPIVLIISLIGIPDILREFFKSLGGIIIPYLYVFVFRHIYFNDVDVFIQQYINEITTINFPIYSLSFTTMFLLLCFFIIYIHATVALLKKINRQSINMGYILRIELIASLLAILIFFIFWGNKSTPLCVILACPFSIILSNYVTANKQSYPLRVELILLMSAVVIARIAYFIN